MSGLTSVAEALQAFGNQNLTDCCGIHDLLNTPGAIGGAITILGNKTGCESVPQINEYCIDADMDTYRPVDGDCDDADAALNPGVAEICDGIDNNCDGQIDNGLAVHSGNVMFTSQAQLDDWYGCPTSINGNVMISGYNITDLTPLANIQSITGNLNIQYTGLASLNGLDNLQSVGGTVTILFNSSLSSLFGLHNLTAVGGNFMMYYNFQLSDCCDITDLLNNGGVVGSRVIYFNASGCNSQAEILAQCQIQNLTSNPNSGANNLDVAISSQTYEVQEAQLFPNPAKDLVNLRLVKSFEQGRLEIFDAQGRSVRQQILSANTLQYQIETATLLSGLYMVKIETDGELAVHRLVVQ
ncbi:MAG: T9SS type A sorting domain-containing protein [Saprospiraceae bacterium]